MDGGTFLKEIRVLFLLYKLGIGGMERVIVNIANNLDKEKYRVYLAYVEDGSYKTLVKPHVQLVKLPSGNSVRLPRIVSNLVEDEQINVVFHSWPKFAVHAHLQNVFRKKRTRVIFRVPVSLKQYLKANYRAFDNPIFRKVLSNTLSFSNHVVALCYQMARELIQGFSVPESKVSVIYNPVDLQYVQKMAGETNPFEDTNGGPHILSIGRLEYQKGFDVLLKAFPKVLNAYPHATLTILGTGRLKRELCSLSERLGIAHKVNFFEWTDNPYAYLKNADLFALPSRYEGFPNVLLEALACGTKIVATDCPFGPSEILGTNGEYGWLVPPEDPDVLANTIIEALKTPVDSGRLIARASEFELERIVKKYEELFQNIARPNVLVFTPKLGGGGAEKISVQLANHFTKHFNTSIVYIEDGPYSKLLSKEVAKLKLNANRVRMTFFELSRLYNILKPDVIFTSQPHATLAVVLWRTFTRTPVKLVARLQNPPENLVRNPIKKYIYGLAYKLPDVLVAQCNEMRDHLSRIFKIPGEKLRVIYNPVDIERVRTLMREGNPFGTDGLSSQRSRVNILSVSRLEYEKGVDVLIKALKLLLEKVPNAHLTILNTGSYESELKRLVSQLALASRVEFAGWQDNPYKYMYHADVVVLPSRREGLPNTLIEALACGAKVVATDCPTGPAEIIGRNERYGWLAPVDDPVRLAEKILEALSSTPRPGVEKFLSETFPAERIVERFVEVINSVLG